MNSNQFQTLQCYDLSATIASGASTSAAIDTFGCSLTGLFFPTMTSTIVKFSVSNASDGTYVTLADGAGSDYSRTFASSKAIALDPVVLYPWRYIKLVVDQTEGGARTIILATRPV